MPRRHRQLRVTAARSLRLQVANLEKLGALSHLAELVLLDLDVQVDRLACLKNLTTLTCLKIGEQLVVIVYNL